jgi:hypothetical protein
MVVLVVEVVVIGSVVIAVGRAVVEVLARVVVVRWGFGDR